MPNLVKIGIRGWVGQTPSLSPFSVLSFVGFFLFRREGRVFFFIFKHSWAPKRSWKISHGGPGKVLDFFVSKRVGTLTVG